MRKNLTISIAAYNVEKYLEKALKSLIIDDIDKLEVLIVNDGSSDNTKKIAEEYCLKYPKTFKLIDKKNGGYGSTINAGIKAATGKYFKQLDGDDWYDTKNLNKLINDIDKINSDIIYTPFVTYYEENKKQEINKNSITTYAGKMHEIDGIIKNVDVFYMHNLAYKTKLLKENKINIDEHCFYTDTEYVILPFMCSKSIYINNYPIYIYRVGVEGQSVSRDGRKKHWKDHLNVSYTLMDYYKNNRKKISNDKKNYCEKYLASIFSAGVARYLMVLKPTVENYKLIKKYNNDIRTTSIEIYNIMSQKSKTVRYIRKFGYPIYYIINRYKEIRGK